MATARPGRWRAQRSSSKPPKFPLFHLFSIQEQLKNSSSDEGGGGRKEGAGQIRIEGQEEVLYSVNKIMQPEEEYIVSRL